ncbi:MAG: hypothetical protein H6670_11115 [Anaerolineaceae bacterium]|nr:hypothetical protein [Anaerolineaceae bacterium]
MNIQTHEMTIDLLGNLRQLVRDVNRRDIRSVDALLSKLTGDANAALMLLRLIYWTPKSKRDGWIYKSWRDWDAECNLSQGQIKRVHGQGLLEAVGVVREVRKANGVPTMHYRLNIRAFLRQIASYLGLDLPRLEALFGVAVPDESNGSDQPDSPGDVDQNDRTGTTKPITDINQHALPTNNTDIQTTAADDSFFEDTSAERESETNLLLLDLVDTGFDLIKAHWLVKRYEAEQIRSVMARSREAAAHNPPGFILTALRESWEVSSQNKHTGLDLLEDGKRYAQGKYADFIDS